MARVEGSRVGASTAPNREALAAGLDRQIAGLAGNPILALRTPATEGARLTALQQLTSLVAAALTVL